MTAPPTPKDDGNVKRRLMPWFLSCIGNFHLWKVCKSIKLNIHTGPVISSFKFSTKFQGKKLKIRIGKSRTGTKQKIVLNELFYY